ncbi:hypothetical protein J4408_03275 [Candidatus Pacearchaeota archaeon]|nr:hypothetical protein [Candidatus Pacearchaeota archaeon]
MDVKENNRREVEARLAGMGDYVRMDYLSSCLKKHLDFDTKKFVLSKLAEIYEFRGMFNDAAKLYKSMADINSTFQGKIKDFVKCGELFVKAGKHYEADDAFKNAIANAKDGGKIQIKIAEKEAYKKQAREYLTRAKNRNAMQTYEKILTLELTLEEKKEVQKSLFELYKKLGRVRESFLIERSMKGIKPSY